MNTLVTISIGELVDKLSILSIKKEKLTDINKLKYVNLEYNQLKNHFINLKIDDDDFKKMIDINKKLWIIEDLIREKERKKEFDNEFIELARSVYITNDLRFEIKKNLNIKYKSDIFEEKSYTNYK